MTRGLDPRARPRSYSRSARAANQPTPRAVKRHRRSPPTPPAPEPANGWPAGGARQGRASEPGSAPARSCTRQIEHSGGAADRSHHPVAGEPPLRSSLPARPSEEASASRDMPTDPLRGASRRSCHAAIKSARACMSTANAKMSFIWNPPDPVVATWMEPMNAPWTKCR